MSSCRQIVVARTHAQIRTMTGVSSFSARVLRSYRLWSLAIFAATLFVHDSGAQSGPAEYASPFKRDDAQFGASVLAYGFDWPRIAIGAPSGSVADTSIAQGGVVYFYHTRPFGGVPFDSLRLGDPESDADPSESAWPGKSEPGDLFGFSLGSEAQWGDEILAIGAPGANAAVVVDGLRSKRFYLEQPNQEPKGSFGYAVDVNHGFMVVGAPRESIQGAAYVWQTNAFGPSSVPSRLSPSDVEDTLFGMSVTITTWNADATFMAIGAPSVSDSGAVYLYHLRGADQAGIGGSWVEVARLTGPREFGSTVELGQDGFNLVIGSPDTIYFYQRSPDSTWIPADTFSMPDEWRSVPAIVSRVSRSAVTQRGLAWRIVWGGGMGGESPASVLFACQRCPGSTQDPKVNLLPLPNSATGAFGTSLSWMPDWGVIVGDPLAQGSGAVFAYDNELVVSHDRVDRSAERASLDVWPNPARKNLHVRYRSERRGPAHISLVDVVGRVVAIKDLRSGTNEDVVNLDLSTLPSGTYVLHLNESGRTLSRMVTVFR